MRIAELPASALRRCLNASQVWPRRPVKPTVGQRIEAAFRAGWAADADGDDQDTAWRRYQEPGFAEQWLRTLQDTGVISR